MVKEVKEVGGGLIDSQVQATFVPARVVVVVLQVYKGVSLSHQSPSLLFKKKI
jgi:hypothetical protein